MKPDDELKIVDPKLYEVAREGGTEAPFSGKYVNEKAAGVYKCAVCGHKLFKSDTKFESGTGWPSFTDPVNKENVVLKVDDSLGTRLSTPYGVASGGQVNRTEVRCANCDAHLGHVFNDGPVKEGKVCDRFCINSVSLNLENE